MKITKNILTYIVTYGLFLIPFIAFVVFNNMFFPFITGKGFTFRILIEILFGSYAYLAIIAPEFRPKWTWITKAVCLFTLVTLVADLFSANVLKSLWSNYERMEGFVLIAHLFLYYIVASSVLNAKRWEQLWNTSIVASIIMSVYCILQLAGKITINQGGVRVDGTFGNSAYLAIYFVFHIFLCIYMLVQVGKPVWQKWAYGLTALLEMVILYFTATRGSILGLIGGLILAALLIIWKERENKILKKSAYAALIAIVVVAGGFYAIRNTSFVKKSPVLSRFVFTASEVENQGRYYVWPMALKGISERPILGWGQESFNFVFNQFYNPHMYGQEQWFDRTHDIVLDWFINAGILGFLAYALLFVSVLYYIWRKKSMMTVAQKSIMTGMLAAYVFHNLFVFDNLVSYILFFSVLAFMQSTNTSSETDAQPSAFCTALRTKTFSSDMNIYLLAPVVVLVTIVGVYFINIPALEANLTLIQAITPQQTGGVEQNLVLFKKAFAYNSFGNSEILEQLVQVTTQIAPSNQVTDAVKQEFFDLTKQQIDAKLKQTPTDARYLVFAGSFYNQIAQYDTAITYLTEAVKYSPQKQSILFELGTSYIGKKDYQGAFNTFQTAYNLDTTFPDAQIIYAVGAIYTKNIPVLQKMFALIPQATVLSDNRILQAYAGIGDYQTVVNIITARLQKSPNDMQLQLSLASAYAQMGQKAKAVAILQAMEKQDPTFKAQGDQYIQQVQAQ